jgi:hypothetical protein
VPSAISTRKVLPPQVLQVTAFSTRLDAAFSIWMSLDQVSISIRPGQMSLDFVALLIIPMNRGAELPDGDRDLFAVSPFRRRGVPSAETADHRTAVIPHVYSSWAAAELSGGDAGSGGDVPGSGSARLDDQLEGALEGVLPVAPLTARLRCLEDQLTVVTTGLPRPPRVPGPQGELEGSPWYSPC